MSKERLLSGQLVPLELLSKSNKILFLTHLAIGDYTYLQNFFKNFADKYPNLKIDIWVDEVRRTRCFWLWKYLKKYALLDWLEQSSFFNKIYAGSYSWSRFNKLIKKAQKEEYPLIVSLCTLRSGQYIKYAKKINPNAFIAGVVNERIADRKIYKKLDACLRINQSRDFKDKHVTAIYAYWFERLFGISVLPAKRVPFVSVPKEWRSYGKLKFVQWGIKNKENRFENFEKVVFINIFAKDVRRCWPVDRLVFLIKKLQKDDAFCDAYFVINVVPEYYDMLKNFLSNYYLNRVYLFTASENFFQLPSIISLCDLVISVETSVIHLAAALQIPVVALMRTKNCEWVPYSSCDSKIIFADKRRDWVEDIPLDKVFAATKSFAQFL